LISFNEAFFNYIKNLSGVPSNFEYGSPVGTSKPFYTMLPVTPDPEQPVSLCELQGGQGVARFQFSVSSGGSAGYSETLLYSLKQIVGDITGQISYTHTDDVTYTFDVWNNVTGGVRALGGVDLNTWDAIFETEIWWKKTS